MGTGDARVSACSAVTDVSAVTMVFGRRVFNLRDAADRTREGVVYPRSNSTRISLQRT